MRGRQERVLYTLAFSHHAVDPTHASGGGARRGRYFVLHIQISDVRMLTVN